jgi:hypothetical protein
VNLGRTAGKLRRLLGEFRFTSVADFLAGADVESLETHAYGGQG